MKKLIVFLLMSLNLVASPSFNCKYASNRAENFICSNLFVADLDVRMALTYRKIVKVYPSKAKGMRKKQKIWMKERNNCTNNFQGKDNFYSCIKYVYNKRIRELETSVPDKLNQTDSRIFYKSGNRKYRRGLYYSSMNYFIKAYNISDNYIDKIRALGAMAVNSKKQGNYVLALKYAELIFKIDSTNTFASDIKGECKKYIARYERSNKSYASSNKNYSSSSSSANYSNSSSDECVGKCFIKALGTEACSAGVEKIAKSSLNTNAYGFLTGPSCELTVSKLLGSKTTGEDLALAAFTGILSDANIDSDSGMENFFGYLARGASILIRVGQLNECTEKCN